MAVGSDLEGTAEIRVAIVQSGKELEIATVRGNNKKTSSFLYVVKPQSAIK